MPDDRPSNPTEVSEDRSWFDRLADTMSRSVARAPFFLVSLAFVVVWAVSGPHFSFSHGWVDTVQVGATLVTFLIVALLENEGWRGNKATQRKLNAIAAGLAELMASSDVADAHVRELHAAVGLEKRESASR
jgi:low affinity Fe/Cu permease